MSIRGSSELLIQLVMDSPLGRLISLMHFDCHSLFLWSAKTQFCLQVFQKLLKSAVKSKKTKITSHPEVCFSGPVSGDQKSHRGRREAMITWTRASFEDEDIKLIGIKEFRVSLPNWQSRGIVRWLGIAPSLCSSLLQSTDYTHSTTHRQTSCVFVERKLVLLAES